MSTNKEYSSKDELALLPTTKLEDIYYEHDCHLSPFDSCPVCEAWHERCSEVEQYGLCEMCDQPIINGECACEVPNNQMIYG